MTESRNKYEKTLYEYKLRVTSWIEVCRKKSNVRLGGEYLNTVIRIFRDNDDLSTGRDRETLEMNEFLQKLQRFIKTLHTIISSISNEQ